MITSYVSAGLGNQLFQYAAGRSLSLRNNAPLKVDYSLFAYYLSRRPQISRFHIQCEEFYPPELLELWKNPDAKKSLWKRVKGRIQRKLSPANNVLTYVEKGPQFDPAVLDLKGEVRLSGFWQSEKYFVDIEPTIRQDLRIKDEFLPNIAPMMEEISRKRAISLHFRRSDYVGDPYFEMQNPMVYYDKAIEYMAQNFEDITFFIFSDDVNWVKANFQTSHPVIYTNENGVLTDIEEMYLMQNCQHHIIANSTFSWWSAWLNPSQTKRICAPRVWANTDKDYSDMVPEAWTRF